MAIYRTNRDPHNPYVQINKRIFEDPNISWAAKGILGYILSKPDGWIVRFYDLVLHGTQKRDFIQKVIKELEHHGYMYRRRIRNPSGRFEYITEVFEVPLTEQAKEDLKKDNLTLVENSLDVAK